MKFVLVVSEKQDSFETMCTISGKEYHIERAENEDDALKMMGKISSDEVRLPLAPMADANREKLRKDLESYGVI